MDFSLYKSQTKENFEKLIVIPKVSQSSSNDSIENQKVIVGYCSTNLQITTYKCTYVCILCKKVK